MGHLLVNTAAAAVGRCRRAALLEHLRAKNVVDQAAISRAELLSVRTGQPVEQVLNQLGALSDEDLAQAYSVVSSCTLWDPETHPATLAPEVFNVPVEFLRRARLLPLAETDDGVLCAACDPLDDEALSGFAFATGRKSTVLVARSNDWRRVFDQVYTPVEAAEAAPDEHRLAREVDQVADLGAEGAGARLVAAAFEAAIALGASDIHFEPHRHDLHVRLRVDGRLIGHQVVSADLAASAVSRVKVIANLDLGEKRLPQDGRTTFVVAGRPVDVRVATSPTVFGEAAVLRILDRASVKLDLDTLGMPTPVSNILRQAAKSPHGMFLVTGPTGSGKTTTLYALLQTFAGSARKVLSVEDPVEYHFEHVSQTQVAPHIGLTFAAALRSFLRQDPDVILVGEIRDPETAAVAVQAAMTGHFVLASVHANDALSVLPRLQDMGVEPYQLAAGFRGAAAQRLVRRLCPDCRRNRPATEVERQFARAAARDAPLMLFEPTGCSKCNRTGFKGRVAIAEAFLADEAMVRAIADGAPLAEIGDIARQAGLRTMSQDGLQKAMEGLTTVDEVMGAVNG